MKKLLVLCEANRKIRAATYIIRAQTDASQTSTENSINNINNNKKKNEEESGLSNSNARGKWSETERANFYSSSSETTRENKSSTLITCFPKQS